MCRVKYVFKIEMQIIFFSEVLQLEHVIPAPNVLTRMEWQQEIVLVGMFDKNFIFLVGKVSFKISIVCLSIDNVSSIFRFGVCCVFLNTGAVASTISENRTRLRNSEFPSIATATTAQSIAYTINKMNAGIDI